jgi:hypothetical protein
MTALTPPNTAPADDRWALAAGLTFLDGVASGTWGLGTVRDWFEAHLVSTGYMPPPISVNEPPVGSFALYARSNAALRPQASLPMLLSVARNNVLAGLRGFLAIPADDRFVTAALFSGRVHRASPPASSRTRVNSARWVPRPEADAPLSALVRSLFAIDVLTHREAYERTLCVCEVCGHVSFAEGTARRRTCPVHGQSPSGFVRRVTLPGIKPSHS